MPLSKESGLKSGGFAVFTSRNTKAMWAEIPKPGTRVQIPPKRLPFFKCGKELKERVDY
jgi:integration host factor subunit beta